MINTDRTNRFITDEKRLQNIKREGDLVTTELQNIETIFQKEDNWPNEKLDEYLSTTQRLIDLFVNWLSHKDKIFLQTIEEYHYAISKKEELKKFDMYTAEIDRARHLMAELYLKWIFNPLYDISVNPMRCSLDELLEICRFIEKDYWTQKEWKVNRAKYHKDYFGQKGKMYLPQLLKEKFLWQKIPEEQIPLFLAIFDEKDGYSMEVFDDILINILGYSDKEFIHLMEQHNLLEA